MRVLVATGLYPPEIGGPATYARLLETHLPALGVSVTIVPFRLVRRYWIGVRHFVYFWHVYRRLRDVDVIIALDPFSVGVPARCAALLRRKRFVVKVVGDYAWEQARQRFDFDGTLESFQSADVHFIPALMRYVERVVARSAHAVIVPSHYLAKVLEEWGVVPPQLNVIYNGVSLADVGAKETIRGVLHFNGTLMISVGRLVPWKGFSKLIEVYAELKKKYHDLTLFIIGSGPDQAHLETRAQECGVADSVIFAGAVDHDALLRYVRAADFFVLNTAYEGFSHLLLETMAVGTPIVTTLVGGNPEIIDDGVNGYLVTPNDSTALKKCITKLLDDPRLRTTLATEGLRKVSHFTDERTAQETYTLLTHLCAS